MSRPFRTLVAALLTGAALCALLLFEDHRIDSRFAALKAELRNTGPVSDPAVFEMLRVRSMAIDLYLDQRARGREELGSPVLWTPVRREELAQRLDSLGSFFEQVDSLLEDEICRFALSQGVITSTSTPPLGISRRRTNALCSRALLDFEGLQGSLAAAKRLGQALDLIRLGDDGSAMGYQISVAEEDTVLSVLRGMLGDPLADASVIRDELGPRLQRVSADDRIASVLSHEINTFERSGGEAARGWIERWRRRSLAVDALETSWKLALASGADARSLYDSERAAAVGYRSSLPDGMFWSAIAGHSHVFMARRDLALRALDIAVAVREAKGGTPKLDPPPVDRFTGTPICETATDRAIEIRSDGALETLRLNPTDPGAALLCWTIPR